MKNLAFIRDCIATELNNEQHDTETKRLINEAYKYICASFARKLTIETKAKEAMEISGDTAKDANYYVMAKINDKWYFCNRKVFAVDIPLSKAGDIFFMERSSKDAIHNFAEAFSTLEKINNIFPNIPCKTINTGQLDFFRINHTTP